MYFWETEQKSSVLPKILNILGSITLLEKKSTIFQALP